MRNLKKVLSLALALVMLLGMMVIGAGAAETTYADLTDNGEIKNVEAVTLMVDLGIIKGVEQEDGTFKYLPADTVNRAVMAKFVYYIKEGSGGADLFKGMSTGLEDVAGHWAEGEINYCYSQKLIAGDGQGHFFPDVDVNVAGAAKMLLTALGYDAVSNGYQGSDDWAINVMKDAKSFGLLKGLNLVATDDLSRDDAAQMVFNALNTPTVTATKNYAYDLNGNRYEYVTGYTPGETLGYNAYGMVKVTATVEGINPNGTAKLTGFTPAIPSAKLLDEAKLTATADMVGGTATLYVAVDDDDAVIEIISSSLVPAVSNVLYTSNGGKSFAALTGTTPKGPDFKVEVSPSAAYYLNGELKTAGEVTPEIEKKGVQAEFIDTDKDSVADVVRVIKKTVGTVSADPATRAGKDGDEIRIPGVLGAWTSVNKVVGAEDLKKGDVVLYYNDGVKTYIEKAATIEGSVDGNNSQKGLQISGKYYDVSGLTTAAAALNGTGFSTIAGWDDFKNEYTFYLDNNENIVRVVKGEGAAEEAVTNYAIVRAVAWFPGSGFNTNGHAEAQLLFTDGTTKTVTIASVDKVKLVAADTTLVTDLKYTVSETEANGDYKSGAKFFSNATLATVTAFASSAKVEGSTKVTAGQYMGVAKTGDKGDGLDLYYGVAATGSNTSLATAIPADRFYSYKELDNGEYQLTNLTTAEAGTLANHVITKGAAKFDDTTVGNANTVFIFDKGADKAPDIYTGINDVPTTTAAPSNNGDANTVVKDANGVAKFVFVKGATAEAEASTDVVYLYETTYTANANGKVVNAIVNGEPGTITIASDKGLAASASTDVLAAPGLYSVKSVNDKGVSTLKGQGGAEDVAWTMVVGIKSVGGGIITVGNNTATYTYDDNTVVYVISKDGPNTVCNQVGMADVEVDGNDQVKVFADSAKADRADVIYIVKVDAPKPTHVALATDASGSAGATVVDFDNKNVGKVTDWTTTTKTDIKITMDSITGNYTTKIKLSGSALAAGNDDYTAGDKITLTAVGTLTVEITVEDNFSKAVETATYTVQVAAPSAG